MRQFLATIVRVLLSSFRSRSSLILENLALRQQLAVLQRTGARPRLTNADRLFWVFLRYVFSGWRGWRLDPQLARSGRFETIHSFGQAGPTTALIQARDGTLYGTVPTDPERAAEHATP